MTQDGTQSRRGSGGLWCVLYLSFLPICTVGLLAVQCLLGGSKRVPFTQQANCFPTPPRTDSLMILAILLFWVPQADKTAG
jgi:hypothetical protein